MIKATMYAGNSEQNAYTVRERTQEQVLEKFRTYYLKHWYGGDSPLLKIGTRRPGLPEFADHYSYSCERMGRRYYMRVLIVWDHSGEN